MCKNTIFTFCLLTGIIANHTVIAQSISQDSLALLDFYRSTHGNNWKNSQNWLSDNPISTWFGIKVVNNRVVELKITNNNLDGPLPLSFGDISELSTVVLSLNGNLNGTIPVTIGKLSKLVTLDLEDNQLTGSIPATLGNLHNLQTLALDFNHLSGAIPQSFGRLTNLFFLELESNKQLGGNLPDSMGYMASLQEFNADDNMFSGPIPATFGNLTNLQKLLLANNRLTGSIPASLGNIPRLQKFDVSVNGLTGIIPASLGNLPKLVSLQLSFNGLTGNVPGTLGNLSSLQFLEINNNHLGDSIPASLAKLPALQQIDLHDNNFTFAGMEIISQKKIVLNFYAPQADIAIKNPCGITLSVSVGGTPANNTYKWYKDGVLYTVKTGDSTLTPSDPGNYYVIATNAVATDLVLHSDTVTASGIILPVINVTANNCSGKPYTLPSGRKITVPGTYMDTVRNAAGCDSVVAIIHLNATTVTAIQKNASATICASQVYALPSGSVVNRTGVYHDTLRTMGGCDSIITTLALTVNGPVPSKSNVSLCSGRQVTLSAQSGTNYSYTWNTGATSSSITTTTAGTYTVTRDDKAGCKAIDSFFVIAYTSPVITLQKNIVVCSGTSTMLDAGDGFKSYGWSTGETTRQINVAATGNYWVLVTDSNNCTGSDTASISRISSSPAGFLPQDTSICLYTSFEIKVGGGFYNYLWSTGSTANAITVNKEGTYALQLTNMDGCPGSDSITITTHACTKLFYMPSAFTPNGDGLNDLFRPANALSITAPAVYRLAVFSRWGQKIFESHTLPAGWDGTVNGIKQPAGVFIWVLSYKFDDTPPHTETGTITLVR